MSTHRSTFANVIAKFLFLLALLAGMFSQAEASTHLQWRDRFEREARDAWLEYLQQAKHLQGTVSLFTEDLQQQSQVSTDVTVAIRQRPEHALTHASYRIRRGAPTSEEEVRVINPLYAFALRRTEPDEQWHISKLDLQANDGFLIGTLPSKYIDQWTAFPVSFTGVFATLEMTTLKPGFEAEKITPVQREGRAYVKVEFTYDPPEDSVRIPELDGWVLYDPERSWIIREFDVRLKYTAADPPIEIQSSGVYAYKDSEDGFPLLQRAVCTQDNITKQAKTRTTYDFDVDLDDLPPRSAFHLTAFGFPEPNDVVRPTPWFLYSLIVGVALLVLAFALYKLAARARYSA